MSYDALATSASPALIIYVLDVSASMTKRLGTGRRIDVVMASVERTLQQMVFRSTKGMNIAPRYRLAMYAYSDQVWDLLDGIKSVDQIAKWGAPQLSVQRNTDTAKAFLQVEKLLRNELPRLQNCPAPLICHMTDGEFTDADPEPVIRRIMGMRVPDGIPLIENIFISDQVLDAPILDPKRWPGVLPQTKLKNSYAQKLQAMSSPLPESYRNMMREMGYQMTPGALMMLPGTSPEMVEMGFVMSAATPLSR
jgi:hypothetical protein